MAGWLRGGTETEELTKPVYSVERGSPLSRAKPFLYALCLLGALAFAGLQVYQTQFQPRPEPTDRVSELESENARLDDELGRARLQAELDSATRNELERQLVELNQRVKKLSEEVSFYKRAQPSEK